VAFPSAVAATNRAVEMAVRIAEQRAPTKLIGPMNTNEPTPVATGCGSLFISGRQGAVPSELPSAGAIRTPPDALGAARKIRQPAELSPRRSAPKITDPSATIAGIPKSAIVPPPGTRAPRATILTRRPLASLAYSAAGVSTRRELPPSILSLNADASGAATSATAMRTPNNFTIGISSSFGCMSLTSTAARGP
jgi:hypothetical protein